VRLAGSPLGHGHNHQPHTRDQDPSDGWKESFYAFPGHEGGFRQHKPRHPLWHAEGQKSKPVPRVLDQVFPVWHDVLAPLSRVALGVRPCLGWHPSGVSHLSATVRNIRVPPPLWLPPRPISRLRRELRSDSFLDVVPTEHLGPTETVRRFEGQRGPLGVSFSIPKTELIHWRTKRDRGPISRAPIHLDWSVFTPKKEVRWLGDWFTSSLSTTPHFVMRLAKAQAAFVAVTRLSPPGMGLPLFLCHWLASSLLFPILSYGADTFTPTAHMTRKLPVFWHKVQRWTTNCFVCTPTDILAVEPCLPPLELLLAYKRRLVKVRILCSPPEINPAAAWLPPSVQTPLLHGHTPHHRTLSAKNTGSRLPLPWLQPRPPAKIRAPLPLDALPHSMLFILGQAGLEPLPLTSQHLLCEHYDNLRSARSYPQLKLQCRSLLMKEWEDTRPDPATYPYRPSLKPHPFMGLGKVSAGRLHQMRSGKSYLRAHLSWNDDSPPTCPRCGEATEDFVHAILHCSAKEPARTRHLQGVSDIGPDAPVWSSAALLGALARFIKSTATAFPPGMFSRPNSSAVSVSSRSSNVVSFAYFMSSQES